MNTAGDRTSPTHARANPVRRPEARTRRAGRRPYRERHEDETMKTSATSTSTRRTFARRQQTARFPTRRRFTRFQQRRLDRETYLIELRPEGPGPPGEVRLKRLLKAALRHYGLRCSSATTSPGSSTPPTTPGPNCNVHEKADRQPPARPTPARIEGDSPAPGRSEAQDGKERSEAKRRERQRPRQRRDARENRDPDEPERQSSARVRHEGGDARQLDLFTTTNTTKEKNP